MLLIKRIKIRSFEIGLLFNDREFRGILGPGVHWLFDPFMKRQVEVVSLRESRFDHPALDMINDSGALKDYANVLDLKDDQRALVWVDGRLTDILGPGLHAYWNRRHEIRIEVHDVHQAQLVHDDLAVIARMPGAKQLLDICAIERDHVGALFIDGVYQTTLNPGLYGFWLGTRDARVVEIDTREQTVDVLGQEIMTADKVSLRMNALITYRIVDARKAISATADARQSLYRDTQLALRAVVGAHELDTFLTNKDAIVSELEEVIRGRAIQVGVEIATVGVRDVVLPGDMKDLMNKVMEARKSAEANLISRREETAAMRSQANTAKVLSDNPTLMRLRELEVLERIAANGNLNVVIGEKGLSDRIVNLL